MSRLPLLLLLLLRFNEAGAVMPRKVALPVSVLLVLPRFNEAGAVMPRKPVFFRNTELGKRSFNEAGAVMPRKLPLVVRTGPVVTASMRPGLLCPGSGTPADHSLQPHDASMRPGLLCPGSCWLSQGS